MTDLKGGNYFNNVTLFCMKTYVKAVPTESSHFALRVGYGRIPFYKAMVNPRN